MKFNHILLFDCDPLGIPLPTHTLNKSSELWIVVMYMDMKGHEINRI